MAQARKTLKSNADEEDEGEKQIDGRDPGRQTGLPQPEPHKAQTAYKQETGRAVGKDLGRIVNGEIATEGLAADLT